MGPPVIPGRTIRGLRREPIPAGYLLGRAAGMTDGPAQLISIASLMSSTNPQALLNALGGARGAVIYRGAGGWTTLAPGTSGQALTTGGAGADPSWSSAGTSLEITDGTNDITGVSKITITGGTVGGATPNATLTISTRISPLLMSEQWPIDLGGVGGAGGGGGASAFPMAPQSTGTQAISFAAHGNVFKPVAGCKIVAGTAVLTTVTAATYKIGVAPYNTGTNQMTGAPTYTAVYTEASGAAHTPIYLAFSSPVALTAGTSYIIFLVRTDSTTTVSTTIDILTGQAFTAVLFYLALGASFTLASVSPLTSDTWTANGSRIDCVGFTYTIP